MALEYLEAESIGGFKVVVMDSLREKYPDCFLPSGAMDYTWFEREIRPHHYIYITKDENSIAFTLQKGPIKEVGVNGCQVDTIIEAAKEILISLNEKFPCDENRQAILSLTDALGYLAMRKANREKRGVEGRSQQ